MHPLPTLYLFAAMLLGMVKTTELRRLASQKTARLMVKFNVKKTK